MPVSAYEALPPIGGSLPSNGFDVFDLSNPALLSEAGFPTYLPLPGDQGSQPSCTAWAIGFAAATQVMRISGLPLSAAISPADLFAKIRNRLTPSACTQGSQISYAMDVLVQEGVATIDLVAYSDQQCGLLRAARSFNLDGFSKVQAADYVSIRGAVASMQPVCFGMQVPSSFSQLSRTNPLLVPNGTGGGHAMAVVGYDDVKQQYKLINSWGQNWGVSGFCFISYADFARYALDVCIPYLRRGSDNALLSATTSNAANPIVANHISSRAFGGSRPGTYGVGAELGWTAPLGVRSASISLLDDSMNILFSRTLEVAQIARALRFGVVSPDGAARYRYMRASITGVDSAGSSVTLSALTKPYQR